LITGAAAVEAAAGNVHRKLLVWRMARQLSILQNVCFADIAALIVRIFALRWYNKQEMQDVRCYKKNYTNEGEHL